MMTPVMIDMITSMPNKKFYIEVMFILRIFSILGNEVAKESLDIQHGWELSLGLIRIKWYFRNFIRLYVKKLFYLYGLSNNWKIKSAGQGLDA